MAWVQQTSPVPWCHCQPSLFYLHLDGTWMHSRMVIHPNFFVACLPIFALWSLRASLWVDRWHRCFQIQMSTKSRNTSSQIDEYMLPKWVHSFRRKFYILEESSQISQFFEVLEILLFGIFDPKHLSSFFKVLQKQKNYLCQGFIVTPRSLFNRIHEWKTCPLWGVEQILFNV